MSYALGQLTAAQANRDMGWSKAKLKRYWDARAKACTQFADEGSCLAQVARHVPVTFAGLGQVNAQDVAQATNIIAGLVANPDATLRRYGPAVVTAADRHIVTPLSDRIASAAGPYMVKYLIPPLAVLYVLGGISAYYSWRSARKLQANRRRRKRQRR